MMVLLMICHFYYLPYPCLSSLGFRSFVPSVTNSVEDSILPFTWFWEFCSEMGYCRFFRGEEKLGCDDLRLFVWFWNTLSFLTFYWIEMSCRSENLSTCSSNDISTLTKVYFDYTSSINLCCLALIMSVSFNQCCLL